MVLLLVLTAATGLGWLIGSRPGLGKRLARTGHPVMMVAIALLLFAMGFSLGSNSEVMNQLGKLGLEAASLALAGGTGAVGLVMLCRRWCSRGRRPA